MRRFKEAIDYSSLIRFDRSSGYIVDWIVEYDVNKKSVLVVETGTDDYDSLEEAFEDLNSMYNTSLDPRDWSDESDENTNCDISTEGEYEGKPVRVRVGLQKISNFKSIIYR